MMYDSSSVIEAIGRPRAVQPRRVGILYGGLVLVLALLLGRSFYLQVVQGSHFRAAAEGNRVAALPIPAPRGIIYDFNGQQLVENVASTDLVFDPSRLPSEDNEGVIIETLPGLIDVPVAEVQAALAQARLTRRVVRVASALNHDTVLAVERAQPHLPGIQLVSSLVRRYPEGMITTPVMGYTSPVSEAELASSAYLQPTDISGKTGLEKTYDELLHGVHGVAYVEVDADGLPQKHIREQAPVPGSDLQLTLDLELQRHIAQVLADFEQTRQEQGDRAVSGAVVALDPRSGAVRALVSYPSYDANIFSQPRLTDQTKNIISDERQLLFNRAIKGMYPPGSTIKPFIAAAALQEGIITPQTTFLSTGGLQIGQWRFPDWKTGGHGVTDVGKAIAESVNTFFYLIAGGDETRRGLGVERITRYLGAFGWGKPTAVDLPDEANGFLPSPAWKQSAKDEAWYIGDTYHLAIGQGDVLVTPLQLAAAMAAVANGGTRHTPFLVRTYETGEGEQEEIERESQRLPVSAEHIATIRAGMRQTVTEGSGRALADEAIALAGKTGTAQVGGGDDTHAWFTSFGPYEEPELVLVLLIERGGEGDRVAVPLAQKIWQWWIENRLGDATPDF